MMDERSDMNEEGKGIRYERSKCVRAILATALFTWWEAVDVDNDAASGTLCDRGRGAGRVGWSGDEEAWEAERGGGGGRTSGWGINSGKKWISGLPSSSFLSLLSDCDPLDPPDPPDPLDPPDGWEGEGERWQGGGAGERTIGEGPTGITPPIGNRI